MRLAMLRFEMKQRFLLKQVQIAERHYNLDNHVQNVHLWRYSKTCLKRPLKTKSINWFSSPIIAICSSKVLQNAPREHSVIFSTFIKLPFVFRVFVLSIFEWSFTQVYCILSDIWLAISFYGSPYMLL